MIFWTIDGEFCSHAETIGTRQSSGNICRLLHCRMIHLYAYLRLKIPKSSRDDSTSGWWLVLLLHRVREAISFFMWSMTNRIFGSYFSTFLRIRIFLMPRSYSLTLFFLSTNTNAQNFVQKNANIDVLLEVRHWITVSYDFFTFFFAL